MALTARGCKCLSVFDEDERGTLSVGKVADIVVLGEDIFAVEPDRLRDLAVLKTIIGGKVVYEAP